MIRPQSYGAVTVRTGGSEAPRRTAVNTGIVSSMAKKRGYSREFTPNTERRVRFEVDRIPPTLYNAVLAKARREGISLRALTLRLWKQWVGEASGSQSSTE